MLYFARRAVCSASWCSRTSNQEKYVKAMRNKSKPIVVVFGPAGTGKTFLACQEGARQVMENSNSKLIITRPTTTVGSDHGYLPGNIDQKLAPWLQPIYDSISKSQEYSSKKNKFRPKIEIAPLAYMRGRTFDNSWIIADEMQNATPEQTKMLLTRLGQNSTLVLTGDLQQCDIEESGLNDFVERYERYEDSKYISVIQLDTDDIVRHDAVKEVLDIYSTQL